MDVPDVLARGAGGSESLRVWHHDGGGFRVRRRLHGGRRGGRDDAPQGTASEPSQGRQAATRGTPREEGHARGAASTAPASGSEAVAPGGSHRTQEDRAPGAPACGAGSAARAREGPGARFSPGCGSATRPSSISGGAEERAKEGGPDVEGPGADARRQASHRAAPTGSASNGRGRASGSPTRVGALGGGVGLLGDRHRHRSRRRLGSMADGLPSGAGTVAGHSRRARSAEADRDADAHAAAASHADADSVLSLIREVSRSLEERQPVLDRDIERSEPAVP